MCFARGCMKQTEKHRARTPERFSARRFFDFFWDVSRETPTFEAIVGWPLSETALKSKRFVRGCPTKVKKTPRESAVPTKSDDPLNKNNDFGTRPRIQRNPRKRWQQLRRRPPLTHAPGARMTVVTQTPSNYSIGRAGGVGK